MEFLLHLNWLAVGQIILIDILLGGDNAIVIAMACRNLPPQLRLKGIIWGTIGAVIVRIVLVAFAVSMLQMPYLRAIGGALLLWIGIQLLAADDDAHDKVNASERLLGAVRTIIVADLIMSIDNVVAVASAAEHAGGDSQLALVMFGIAVSIPIIVWGSTLVLKLMQKFPVVITFGAALLGYLAGEMIRSDVALMQLLEVTASQPRLYVEPAHVAFGLPGIIGAIVVVVAGHWLAHRKERS